MLKYNYKGAAALWDEYYTLCVDPWELGDTEKQQERRYFMRAITRGEDIAIYTNHITETIEEMRPVKDAKSRCFDFKYENDLNELKARIERFSEA